MKAKNKKLNIKRETVQFILEDGRKIVGGYQNESSIILVSEITKDIPTAGDVSCKDYPTVSG